VLAINQLWRAQAAALKKQIVRHPGERYRKSRDESRSNSNFFLNLAAAVACSPLPCSPSPPIRSQNENC
jgi:hypothetical protein